MPKCDSNKVSKRTLLKLHFGMGVLLQICCEFSQHLFLRTSLDGCFCELLYEMRVTHQQKVISKI